MIEYSYPVHIGWLASAGLLAAALVLASYLWAKGRSKRGLRLALSAVRWIVLAAVVYFLLDPEWIDSVKHEQKSRVAVLVDTSRSMSIKDLPKERLSAAKSWVENQFRPAAPANFSVNYYTFNSALSGNESLDAAKAAGESTAFIDALDNIISLPSEEPLTGVVLCSDGIENVRKDADAVARTYRRKGIPIHTLTVGTTNDMEDIIVENVQVRRAVPNQAPTRVTVSLRAPGYANQSVPVEVLHANQPVAMQNVRLTGASQQVEIDFTPKQKGFQVYEVRVPAQKGEWLSSNNRRLFGLDVIDPTIRVIYMEGTPQQPNSPIPEWKYLKSALESDPNIKVKTLYREFSATGKRLHAVDTDPETGEHIYPVEHPSRGFPRTLDALLEYDVVVHSDIRKESFTPGQLENMERLVEEFGGGFVMIGGNSAFGKGGYHRTILDRIIPVAMRQQNDSESRPFQVVIPRNAWTHPVIALGQSRAETELIWTKKFPFFYGCNQVDRAKPGATILAVDPSTRNTTGASSLVLAVQTIGKGRSMAFTSDTTRTWGKDFETLWGEPINPRLPLSEENCDGRYYRQFWVNAIRWLAAARLGRTNNNVSLELAQSYCAPQEKVRASVKVQDKELREINNADVFLQVSSEGKTNTAAKAAFDNSQRCYSADLTLPLSGEFVVTALANSKGTRLGEDRQLLVCEAVDREMRDLKAKPEAMAAIARISGGKVLTSDENNASLLSSVFNNAPPVTIEYRRSPLWDKSWWLAAVLALLSLEWGVRRWHGMA